VTVQRVIQQPRFSLIVFFDKKHHCMCQALAWTRPVTDWLAHDIGHVQQEEETLKRRQLLRRFFQGDSMRGQRNT
jgi:hypothetical protein